MIWLTNNIIGIISILASGFIGYHVYFLSKRIDLKDRLAHKDRIEDKVDNLLVKIRKGSNSKVELINVKKYLKYYPDNNELNKDGYTYLGAELKGCRFNGVEFFCGVKEIYKKDGKLTLKNEEGAIRESYNIYEVGLIPYEWIEYVDEYGDEFSYRPQFFSSFNGQKNDPYKYITYYKIRDTYEEGHDPIDFKYGMIEIEK